MYDLYFCSVTLLTIYIINKINKGQVVIFDPIANKICDVNSSIGLRIFFRFIRTILVCKALNFVLSSCIKHCHWHI